MTEYIGYITLQLQLTIKTEADTPEDARKKFNSMASGLTHKKDGIETPIPLASFDEMASNLDRERAKIVEFWMHEDDIPF